MKKLAEYFTESEQAITEKAVSQQQQKFMGMVHAMQKGEKVKGASPELKKVARTMGKKDAKDFASTKHKGLPKKVGEQVVDEEGPIDDYLAKGGKVTVGKYHGPRKSEKTEFGSRHIGTGRPGKTGAQSGVGANVGIGAKPIVRADIHGESKCSALLRGINEAQMVDEGHDTLDHILSRFKHEVKNFVEGGELDDHLYDALFDYYLNMGEIPYGVAKARTGDPYQWIGDKLYNHLESQGLVEVMDPMEIPAYKRKMNPSLGDFPVKPTSAPELGITRRPRPEDIPAVQRKAAGRDFPVTLDQVHDTSDKLSHIDTLRKMAGLPPRM